MLIMSRDNFSLFLQKEVKIHKGVGGGEKKKYTKVHLVAK